MLSVHDLMKDVFSIRPQRWKRTV